MRSLALTVIGDDRPGLVDALAEVISRHGGSWSKGHLARLGGQFAGIVLASVPDDRVAALTVDLDAIGAKGVLEIQVKETGDATHSAEVTGRRLSMHLIGQDRPGIVHEIAAELSRQEVSILELETATVSAPMSGELLFEARAELLLPAGLATDDLCGSLETIADELMVDLEFGSDGVD